jgi:hypothetical protein
MSQINPNRHIALFGGAVGLDSLEGLLFRADKPHDGCRICGAVFQTDYDRNPVGQFKNPTGRVLFSSVEAVNDYALHLRREWSRKHNKQHTEREHRLLRLSGRWCTPEAAHRLAAFGVISLVDLALDDEVASAYRESNAVPIDDSEG